MVALERSSAYNAPPTSYSDAVPHHVMKLSGNGQVSIPADVRRRWSTDRIVVVDLGDRLVVGPLGDDPIGDLWGKYRGRGPSTDDLRAAARAEDAESEERRLA